MAFSQDDLADSLARYINPDHEEFDLESVPYSLKAPLHERFQQSRKQHDT